MYLTFTARDWSKITTVPNRFGFDIHLAFCFDAHYETESGDLTVDANVTLSRNAHANTWEVRGEGWVTRDLEDGNRFHMEHRRAPSYFESFTDFRFALDEANRRQGVLDLQLNDILTRWNDPDAPGIVTPTASVPILLV